MRTDEERLQDILQAIREIEAYAIIEQERFSQDRLIQGGILYQLIIIGEAAGDISEDLRIKYCNIPWKQLIGMRDILAHQYFKIDLGIIWQTIVQDLFPLKTTVIAMLQEIKTID